jgi:hypothetical protein
MMWFHLFWIETDLWLLGVGGKQIAITLIFVRIKSLLPPSRIDRHPKIEPTTNLYY